MKKLLFGLLAVMLTSFTFAQTQVTLSGSYTLGSGTSITSQQWKQVSGPSTAPVITTPTSLITTVTGFAIAGVYAYSLTVTDNLGNSGSDTVQITVLPANLRPHANAGPDQTIQIPGVTGFNYYIDKSDVAIRW